MTDHATPAKTHDTALGNQVLQPWQIAAVERLVELLTEKQLKKLIGQRLPVLDGSRRHRRREPWTRFALAVALLTGFDRDLLSRADVRRALAAACGDRNEVPKSWRAGKGSALRFTEAVGLPRELAGRPVGERPPEYEVIEERPGLPPLQPFQDEVMLKLLRVLVLDGGRALMTLPTGAGKTRVAVESLRQWLNVQGRFVPGARLMVVWLAHTEELCEQACSALREVWQATSGPALYLFRCWGPFLKNVSEDHALLDQSSDAPCVLVMTPQRLVNLIDHQAGAEPSGEDAERGTRVSGHDAADALAMRRITESVGLVVVDEAHRAAAPTYTRIFQWLHRVHPPARLVGLTATPFRQEYEQERHEGTLALKRVFDGNLIEAFDTLGPSPRTKLQEMGVLARPVVRTVLTRRGVPAVACGHATDFENDQAIAKVVDVPERRALVLDELRAACAEPGSLVLYFGPSVADAHCVAFLLRLAGIRAAAITADTHEGTRRQLIEDFRRGRIQVLCNCQVLTTGFDAPRITHIFMARPTVSQVLYEQSVGRGLRGPMFGGTESCHIIDFEDDYRGVSLSLGFHEFRRVWGLE